MSLFELLVIFVVAFLLMKPEDLPEIIKKIKDFNNFCTRIKQEVILYFDPTNGNNDEKIEDNIDKINFYLEKIASVGCEYEGEYSLEKIRNYYKKIIKNSINQDKDGVFSERR